MRQPHEEVATSDTDSSCAAVPHCPQPGSAAGAASPISTTENLNAPGNWIAHAEYQPQAATEWAVAANAMLATRDAAPEPLLRIDDAAIPRNAHAELLERTRAAHGLAPWHELNMLILLARTSNFTELESLIVAERERVEQRERDEQATLSWLP